MSLPGYPQYKDSEISWLGQVPTSWAVVQARRLFEQRRDAALPEDEQLSATQKYGVVPQRLFMELEDQKVVLALSGLDNFKHVEPNDFVISLRSFQGGIEHSAYGGCVSPAYTVLRATSKIAPDFWAYLLKSDGYISALQTTTDGIRDGKNISYMQFGALCVPVPNLDEQSAIATFLDRETGKIDALIVEQGKLLALLAEKRQATISHAVTRGLNPDVPMKESGVAWLGEVPTHWVKTPIKHVLHAIIDSEHKTAPFYEDGAYMVVRTSNIKSGRLVLDDAKYTDMAGYTEWTSRGRPEPGDIIFTREAPAGEACIVPAEFPVCLGQRTVLMKTDKTMLNPCYGLWSIYGGLASEFVALLAQGSTVSHFNMSDIGNIPVLLPPLEEQAAIVSFIDGEIGKLDTLKAEAERAINLLTERRSAVIAAAVTGKIDVRNAVPQELAA
ncbi:restriction endonuclease subunit S [Burkholderia territorii]|uniref:restriction endonuclease subunit S n=1 Tax=Burkholderia territorii TaxID=1503055 RepID=UPI00075D46CB|nr:restriction endonuclease subunit S [Burkholderia territorii]